MRWVQQLLLDVKRQEGGLASAIHDAYRWVLRWNMPDTTLVRLLARAASITHEAVWHGSEMLAAKLVYEPMARARFASLGKGVHLSHLPYVLGHCHIHVGDGCSLSKLHVYSGRFFEDPELHIGAGTMIGWGAHITVNRRVTIGEHVGIASHVTIADSDGHPAALERRLRNEPMTADDIKPVTIGDHVWIGRGAQVLKGVTIGRGAVVAANSVVTSDVPAGALAMGVPARVILRPWEGATPRDPAAAREAAAPRGVTLPLEAAVREATAPRDVTPLDAPARDANGRALSGVHVRPGAARATQA